MLGELATVVPGEGMHARSYWIQDAEDGLGHHCGGAVGHLAQPHPTALAIHQGDDANRTLADNRVALPVAHTIMPVDDGRTFVDAPPTKALAFPRRTAAVAPTSLAPAQVPPQRATALPIDRDVFKRPATFAQPTNLVTFLLAQMRVAHVQLHLPVKWRRLPHLRRFVGSGVALQN